MSERPIRRVLVANRGEVAVRVIRACRQLGLDPVAVYSDADASSSHVRLADRAVRIGPPPARQSYLDAEALLAAAATAGADSVHPGYGMLAEDPDFARAVTGAGLTWVGPSAEVIAVLGDKVAARDLARRCGVPVVPGSDGPVGAGDASAVAERIGWPLVVKASFGGGGRGLRIVRTPTDLADAVAAAGREAAAAFGRSEVHLERYVERARHVEVQVLGDRHGGLVHLGDRDCSVQRRHQKLIEEAPAPGLAPDLARRIRDAALRLTREVGHQGAGTVEFLVTPDGEWYFLEANPRLQVEHGVTELITGIDLVAAQLRIAAGERLWFGQDDMRFDGHAVQARVAAEDPWSGFAPAPGRIGALRLPGGPGVRCDFGVDAGDPVPGEYDSMIGKVLAWAPDRDGARRRLAGALDELRVGGLPTTAPYLRTVLDRAEFAAAAHDTGSVERDWLPDPAHRPAPADRPGPAAGGGPLPGLAAPPGPVPGLAAPTGLVPRQVRIATSRGPLDLAVPGAGAHPGAARRTVDARAVSTGPAAATGDAPVAPMDATVVATRVEVGQTVAPGDLLAVLEAMKMELDVRAGREGTVEELLVAAGDPVSAGQPLVRLS